MCRLRNASIIGEKHAEIVSNTQLITAVRNKSRTVTDAEE